MSADSRTRSMKVVSRYYRPVVLALGVVGIGLMGAPCAFPMPVVDNSNRYYCVPVSGTLPLEVYGQPAGGTFTWTGLVEPNTGPLVTFHAPNTPGQYEVSVTYHYEHPDPRIIYEDYTISGPINVLAMAEIIGRDWYNTYPDGPGAWVVPRGCTTDCTILEAVVTPNVVKPFFFPADMIQWTGGYPLPYILPSQRAVPTSQPGVFELTATCGPTSAGTTVKVVQLESLTVTGATRDTRYLGQHYVTAWSPTGEVTVTANLNLPVTNQGAQGVLGWWGDGGGDPNDWLNQRFPLNQPFTGRVRAYVSSADTNDDEVYLTILQIHSMTIGVAGGPNSVRTHPPEPNEIWARGGAWYAALTLSIDYEPLPYSGFAGQYVVWDVLGDRAEPNQGDYLPDGGPWPPCIRLYPTPENRTYTVRVGIDQNFNGVLDANEVVEEMTVRVVTADLGIDSNNDGQITPSDDYMEECSPGKTIPLNGDPNDPNTQDPNNLVEIRLNCAGGLPGAKWMLGWWPPPGYEQYFSPTITVWRDREKTQPVESDPNHWIDPNHWLPASEAPSVLYVEGILPSTHNGDTYLRLWYDAEGMMEYAYEDTVRATVTAE